jgi:DNA (cytosine-5)-methyltransferase 1
MATVKSNPRTRIRVLDLFSGAGGLSTGFLNASRRFQVVQAVESDVTAAATYAANHKTTEVFSGPIEDWLKSSGAVTADIVIGGPPCQGFSALGKQQELDRRNQLWLRYAETIRRVEPKFFVLENVPAFLNSKQLARFKRQCQPKGPLGSYSFEAKVLNAADYGVAQARKRVILMGHHRDLPAPGYPEATHAKIPDDTHEKWRTLEDALSGLEPRVVEIDLPERQVEVDDWILPGVFRGRELHLTRHYEPISRARFRCIPEGGNRFDIRESLLPDCWRNHRSGAGDVMGRLRFDKPSVTIRTEFFKPEKGRYLHPTEHRAITHLEASRIQGFPDSYRWVGSKFEIARQIGNAVPVPLGTALAAHLARAC